MRVELPPTELAEVLSPSQVRCFMDCQVRWWFKYGLRYPDPLTGNLALGRAVHAALALNFEQKMQSYEDLPILGVIALFRQAWAAEREETEFRDDEDPQEFARFGEDLIRKYLEEVAPTIAPAAVEQHVEGEIAGVYVQGWIDVLDVHGRILEIKTAELDLTGAPVSDRNIRAIDARSNRQCANRHPRQDQNTWVGDAKIQCHRSGSARHPGALPNGADRDAIGALYAQPHINELLAAELLLLEKLRAGVGR